MRKSEREEVIQLTWELMDQRIKRARLARLEELLSESEEALDLYLELAHDESNLKELLSGVDCSRVAPPERDWRRLWVPVSAVAATVVLFAFGWHFSGREEVVASREESAQSAPGGFLTGGLGVRWEEGSRPLSIGSPIPDEKVTISSGALEVTCSNGVVLLLEGPASFRLRDEMNLDLDYGNLVAEVPEAGRGFSVLSGDHKLVDHGTKFGIRVSRDRLKKPTEIAVFQGEVEVIPNGGAIPVMLGKFDAVALTSENESGVYSIPLDQSKFLKELPLGEIPWEMPKIPQGQTKIIEFDVTALVRGPGQYFAVFKWMFGATAVTTSRVALLRDGVRVWNDDHVARTGVLEKTNDNIYRLLVPEESYRDAKWTLRMEASCDVSTAFRLTEDFRKGLRPISDFQGVLYFDDAGFLSEASQDFLGKWNYSYNGLEYQREFFADGTAVLRYPDGKVLDGVRWWLEGEVMHMFFGETQRTERLLLRGGTLLFVDRPYRNAVKEGGLQKR